MRRVIITIELSILMVIEFAIAAENKYFYSSGKILPGEEWANVYVYNDITVVDMNGGIVDGIASFDASKVNISGGHVMTADSRDFSKINISGGYVYGPQAWNNGTITFSDNAESMSIGALDSGKVIMTGGTTYYLAAGYSGTIDLYGGTINDSLGAGDLSIVNIFGYNLIKVPTGGTYGKGQVYGYWQDWTPFTINLVGSETYSHINLIPEPASFLLFGFGALILRRKR